MGSATGLHATGAMAGGAQAALFHGLANRAMEHAAAAPAEWHTHHLPRPAGALRLLRRRDGAAALSSAKGKLPVNTKYGALATLSAVNSKFNVLDGPAVGTLGLC